MISRGVHPWSPKQMAGFRPKQTPQILSQLYPHVPVDNDIGYKMCV